MSKLASRSTWPVRGCRHLLLQEQKTPAQLTETGIGITETETTEGIGSGHTAQGSSIIAGMHQIGIKTVLGAPAVIGMEHQTGTELPFCLSVLSVSQARPQNVSLPW